MVTLEMPIPKLNSNKGFLMLDTNGNTGNNDTKYNPCDAGNAEVDFFRDFGNTGHSCNQC